jgi:hypothetical protein
MMTGSHGSKFLASHGIIPVVASPNPQDKTNLIHVPFGPLLDMWHQPVPAGQCFPESHLCAKFRLKAGKEFNDVWHSNVWQANGLGLRIIEKNGLTLFPSIINDGVSARPGSLIDSYSPLGEVERVWSESRVREGFPLNASGGNAVIAGLVLPNARGAVAGDRGTFETTQSVSWRASLGFST